MEPDLRYRCAPTGALAGCVQIATGARNPHQKVLRTCQRGEPLRLGKRVSASRSRVSPPLGWQIARSRVFPILGWRMRVFAAANLRSDKLAYVAETNNASRRGVFAHPPRRNSDNFASPVHSNWQATNNRGAKFVEFRLTRKKKKY